MEQIREGRHLPLGRREKRTRRVEERRKEIAQPTTPTFRDRRGIRVVIRRRFSLHHRGDGGEGKLPAGVAERRRRRRSLFVRDSPRGDGARLDVPAVEIRATPIDGHRTSVPHAGVFRDIRLGRRRELRVRGDGRVGARFRARGGIGAALEIKLRMPLHHLTVHDHGPFLVVRGVVAESREERVVVCADESYHRRAERVRQRRSRRRGRSPGRPRRHPRGSLSGSRGDGHVRADSARGYGAVARVPGSPRVPANAERHRPGFDGLDGTEHVDGASPAGHRLDARAHDVRGARLLALAQQRTHLL